MLCLAHWVYQIQYVNHTATSTTVNMNRNWACSKAGRTSVLKQDTSRLFVPGQQERTRTRYRIDLCPSPGCGCRRCSLQWEALAFAGAFCLQTSGSLTFCILCMQFPPIHSTGSLIRLAAYMLSLLAEQTISSDTGTPRQNISMTSVIRSSE